MSMNKILFPVAVSLWIIFLGSCSGSGGESPGPSGPTQFTLSNPSQDPSSRFGAEVRTLPVNGNIVVTDPVLTVNGVARAGAVYLFNGRTGALISTLAGTATDEAVGGGGIGVLTNGNFVVFSDFGKVDANHLGYSATFVNGVSGLNGTVSISNSLVQSLPSGGSTLIACLTGQPALSQATCQVSLRNIITIDPTASPLNAQGSSMSLGIPPFTNESFTFIALPNGNYLVLSPGSDSGGAVTFGSGTTGVSGAVSAANSLIGNKAAGDVVGATQGLLTPMSLLSGITVFANGNYVVNSQNGTVTFGSGTTGAVGTIPAASSLPGSLPITELANGNYVVAGSGGLTLVDGTTLTPVNTLTGGGSVIPLPSGDYVVVTPSFNSNIGAVTFVNGVTGLNGAVSAVNSLVGGSTGDQVGSGGVVALANGNYVILSPNFGGGVGAATHVDVASGTTGTVSSTNSLVGAAAGDAVGSGGGTALANGNYVVFSPSFGGGIRAVTFGNGTSGRVGTVSAANSLVGEQVSDTLASGGIIPLSGGSYLVVSPNWANGATTGAGAVSFGNATAGVSGTINAGNSLVGTHVNDHVGSGIFHDEDMVAVYPLSTVNTRRTTNVKGVILLANGNYVVMSPDFSAGDGAATFGNGTTGVVGAVTSSNSLVGSQGGDHVGGGGVVALPSGNYVVLSPLWSNGTSFATGAVTFGNGTTGVAGSVTASNSLVGAAGGDFIGFTGFNFLTGLPSNPTVHSAVIYQTLFSQSGGTGDGVADLGQFGIGAGTSILWGKLAVLGNGNYAVMSPYFNGESGAVTLASGTTGVTGTVSAANSTLGAIPRGYFGAAVQDNAAVGTVVVSGLPEMARAATTVVVR
jgi:hypothetical protein